MWKLQQAKQIDQVVGEAIQEQAEGVGQKTVTAEPVGAKAILEFLDAVLALAAIVRLITRRGQGQFPNYEKVLPKAPLEARVVFRREEVLEGLAKLSPTARKAQVPAVKLELSHSPVSIKTENDGTASSIALEHTRVSGKARDIGFNHQYLTQYVKSVETDTVSMKLFPEAISEVALFDTFRYQHLLMPLRL